MCLTLVIHEVHAAVRTDPDVLSVVRPLLSDDRTGEITVLVQAGMNCTIDPRAPPLDCWAALVAGSRALSRMTSCTYALPSARVQARCVCSWQPVTRSFCVCDPSRTPAPPEHGGRG